jgi:hypothetical protein
MKQSDLEKAIYELDYLIKSNENKEFAFQKYLEENLIVFSIMGYRKAFPQLRLQLNDEDQDKLGLEFLEPDFIVEKQEGIYEIFEIKTPQETFLTKSKDRKAFKHKINSYISQSSNYSEYFQDSSYRAFVKEKYGLDITRNVDVVILAGLDKETDVKRVHEEIRRNYNRIQILTYDRLLNNLRFDYISHYPSHGNLSGKSLHGIFEFNKMPKDNRKYIFDYGHSIYKNRFSVYLNKTNKIVLELLDDDGELYKSIGPSMPINERIALFCQFGSSDEFSLFEASLGGKIVLSSLIDQRINFKIDSETAKIFTGTSMDKKYTNSDFYAYMEAVANIFSFEERMDFDKAVSDYLQAFSKGSSKMNCFWIGKGGWLVSEGKGDSKSEGNTKFLNFLNASS